MHMRREPARIVALASRAAIVALVWVSACGGPRAAFADPQQHGFQVRVLPQGASPLWLEAGGRAPFAGFLVSTDWRESLEQEATAWEAAYTEARRAVGKLREALIEATNEQELHEARVADLTSELRWERFQRLLWQGTAGVAVVTLVLSLLGVL